MGGGGGGKGIAGEVGEEAERRSGREEDEDESVLLSTLDADERRENDCNKGFRCVGYGLFRGFLKSFFAVLSCSMMTIGTYYALLEVDQDERQVFIVEDVRLMLPESLGSFARYRTESGGLIELRHILSSRRRWQKTSRDLYRRLSDIDSRGLYVVIRIMAPVTRRGPNTLPNNTNPNNMTPESVQAMIDQALLRNSTNGDGSHSSHGDNQRNVQTTRPCFYADFMKCQPLNFKGTEGVVSLTRWIEKMESVFNISGCAIKYQVKFATCTLLGASLTWWNSQIRTLGPDAYSMTWEGTIIFCVQTYTDTFPRALTLICTKFASNETKKVDKDLLDQKSGPHGGEQQGKKTTKGRLTIHPETTMAINNNPSRDRMSPRSSGNTNVANAQRDNKVIPKGNVCFECGASGHFKRDFPKLKNKDGEMGMHKAGYTQLEMRRRMGMHRETQTPIVHGERNVRCFWHCIRQEGGRQVGRKATLDVLQPVEIFRKCIPEDLARVFLQLNGGILDRISYSRMPRNVSSSTVSIGTVQNEGIVETTARAFR
ncbi:putative reverse transcriptase domain-containing protein [Tanacetum coccineum]|uniref:Reverse transcriptase domain-containing protein n=1 Tax=Tanacetum coccineum TaxID=301880 RepID=A0ABQ5FEM9_9ASTR